MPLGVEPAGVDKMRICHTELRGALVHQFRKRRLRAADVLRHGDRRVVCRAHADRLHELVEHELLARLKPDLASAHAVSVLADGHDILHRDAAVLHGFEREQQRHDFRDGCDGDCVVGRFLIEHLPRVRTHEDGVAARHVKGRQLDARGVGRGLLRLRVFPALRHGLLRACRRGPGHYKRKRKGKRRQFLFHGFSPFHSKSYGESLRFIHLSL